MTVRDVLRSARRHWVWVVVPVVVLVTGIGFLSSRADPVYRSTASLYVSLSAGETAGDLNQGSSYTQSQMLSFARLATLPVTLGPVAEQLGAGESARSLAGSVAASTPKDTSFIDISVSGGDPEVNAEIANAVATQLGVVIEDLAPSSDTGRTTITATVVDSAVPSVAPISPNTRRNVLAAGVAGLMLGLVAAYLRDALDTRVRRPEALSEAVDAPVLGSVRLQRRGGRRREPTSALVGAQSEDFRRVRTNLQMIGRAGQPRSFVFTSALSGEGKSFVAARVSEALAAAGVRVLLIDADLRRPTIASQLAIEGSAGLTEVLVGRASFDDVRQDLGPNFAVLVSGSIPPNPAELLSYPEFADLLTEVAQEYDVVIIDAPPLLPVADAVVIARLTTGAVVVADATRVRRAHLKQAVDAIRVGGGHVVGTVLNKQRGLSEGEYAFSQEKTSHRRRRAGADAVVPALSRPDHRERPEAGTDRPLADSPAPATAEPGDVDRSASPSSPDDARTVDA